MTKQEMRPAPWWVNLFRVLWKVIAVLATGVILGAVASPVATWLTSSNGTISADSPLDDTYCISTPMYRAWIEQQKATD